jgi:hypothetical protein
MNAALAFAGGHEGKLEFIALTHQVESWVANTAPPKTPDSNRQ